MAERFEVILTLNDRNFTRGVSNAKREIGGLASAAGQGGGALSGLLGPLAGVAAALGGVAAAFGAVRAAVTAASEMQNIAIVLETITGSAGGAQAALQLIRDYARETAFEFQEIANAAPLLATISPTFADLRKNVKLAGDIAAAFGMSYQDAAAQLQRAFSGGAQSADMFREKGVLAAMGFQAGVSYSVEETRKKFEEFGKSIDGAAQRLNQTFTGAVSQMVDALFDFNVAIGENLMPEMQAAAEVLREVMKENKDAIDAAAKSIGIGIVEAIFAFLRAAALMIDVLHTIFNVLRDVGRAFWAAFGDVVTAAANIAAKAIGFVLEGVAKLGIGLGHLINLVSGNDSLLKFFQSANRGATQLRQQGLAGVEAFFGSLASGITITSARDAVENFISQVKVKAAALRFELELARLAAENFNDKSKIALGGAGAGNAIDGVAKKVKALKESFKDIRTFEEYKEAFLALKQAERVLGSGNEDLRKSFDSLRSSFSKTFDEFRDTDNIDQYVASMAMLRQANADGIITSGQLIDVLEVLTNSFKRVIEPLKDIPTLEQFLSEVARYQALLNDGKISAEQFTAAQGNLSDAFKNIVEPLKDLDNLDDFITQFDRYKELLKDSKITTDDFAQAQENLRDAFDDLEFGFAGGIPTLQEYDNQLKLLDEQLKAGRITLEQFDAAKRELDESFLDSEGIGMFISRLGEAQVALSEGLATALMDGKSVLDEFKNFFKRMINQIIADIIRLMILQPIISSIFGAFGRPITFAPGGAIQFEKRAGGGPVIKNKPYIVGERGAELFVPTGGGSIVPNDRMGGGATQVTYNINAVDALSFKQLVARDPEFLYSVTQAGARRLPR
jgi:hypothetical protein